MFSPELVLESKKYQKIYEKVNLATAYTEVFDHKVVLGRLHMLSDMLDYDKIHPSYYSPFRFRSYIDQAAQGGLSQFIKEGGSMSKNDFYFSPHLMKIRLVKPNDFQALAADPALSKIANFIVQ